nr:MAG TPA: hypothetical protein [Caudoviricetes sp.]
MSRIYLNLNLSSRAYPNVNNSLFGCFHGMNGA